jgi:VWFA-related protein
MRVGGISLIALSILPAAALLGQQSDPPQFRAGVELIQLDVTVLDDNRRPVRGLTASDFTVLEDGTPRPIRAFTPVELVTRTRTTEAVWASEVPPDVATNNIDRREGRLVVILMDRTIPVQEGTLTARRIATAAIDALGPDDLAAVVSTSNGAVRDSTIQNFTSDRTRLLRAINAADPSTGFSYEARQVWERLGDKLGLNPLSDGRCLCGLCVPETMTRVAEAVQHVPRRRKLLLFIGTNIIWQTNRAVADYLGNPDPGCETRLEDARNALFRAVDRANLTVHAIDPQSLINIGPQTQASTPSYTDLPGRPAQKQRLDGQEKAMRELLEGQQNIRLVPDRTGGRTVINRNDPDRTVPEIYRETEAYYLIGFERGTSGRPSVPRAIDVKVGRRGLRAYAQRQYVPEQVASRATPAASAQDALSRLLPSAAVPLSLAVTAFATPDSAKAIVRANIDTGAFARRDGTPAPLDISLLATDRTGQPVASARQTSTIPAASPTATRPAEVSVHTQLELEPGDYAIRVAVSDPAAGTVASVFSDVTVPKFDSAPLTLSSVSIESAAGSSAAPSPTTRRVFTRADRVRAVAQIYQGTSRSEPIVPVTMRVQIVDAKGTAVRDQSLPFSEASFTNRRADCAMAIPVANLPAGEYVLKLEASTPRQQAGRALRFAIE